MKSIFKTLLILSSVTLMLTQCKKKEQEDPQIEEPTPTPAPTGINTIAEVFTAQGAPTQTFNVASGVATTLTVNGVKIEIPANVFLTSVGGSTITGNVDLTVRTILDKSEIILSGAGANSTSGKLVSTKGCVKITASQNTQALRLLPGGGGLVVGVTDGTVSPPPMKEFYAGKISAVDSTKIWALGTSTADIPSAFDSQLNKFVHKASLDSLKWLNVGTQFDTTGAKTAVTVSVASQFNKTNSAIYLSFNGSLTVGALFEISPGIFRISGMPVGKGAHLVAVAVINGQYYSAVQSLTISPTQVNLNLAATTITQIKTQLSALP